jgi:hypothetical protein
VGDALPVLVLWVMAALLLGGYTLLFLAARRPVAVRPARVASLLGVVVALRLLLLACGSFPTMSLDLALTILAALLAGGLALLRRVWLVRSGGEELRRHIQTACRGLFLEVQEPQPGRLRLTARGEHWLRLIPLTGRLQLLVLCRARGSGKVPLLLNWLSRQYPGPVPRIRIVLKGGSP